MTTNIVRLATAVAAALIPSFAWAQHEGHQPASPQGPTAELTQCLHVQPVIQNIIAAATSRAEAARLSNSPAEMRAAVEQLEAALRDIRVQSEACFKAAASTDPHAGHMMSAQPRAGAPAQTPSGATDPHAGHTMPGAAPASKSTTRTKPAPSGPAKPAVDSHAGHTKPSAGATSKGTTATKPATSSKPAATKPEGAKAADPHVGHSAAESDDKQRDPVNGLMVDPATAPKTTYQGQTYYFSSEQSREEFLKNPAKFAKKPKA